MDLMEPDSGYNVFECVPRVYSNSNIYPPYYVGKKGSVRGSLVANGCSIEGNVKHSIISSSAIIGEGTMVEDSIVLPNVKIGKNCKLTRCIIDEKSVIPDNSVIGKLEGDITVVGRE